MYQSLLIFRYAFYASAVTQLCSCYSYPAVLTLFRHPDREFQNSAFCPVTHNADMQATESELK